MRTTALPTLMAWAAVLLLSNTALAQQPRPTLPTEEDAKYWLAPKGRLSPEERQLAAKPFEFKTEVPGITIQNLPSTQRLFRATAIRAISKDVSDGAWIAQLPYESELRSSWIKIVVPRGTRIFGESASVVLLRTDKIRKHIDVSIRGTVNLDDVLRDLDAAAVKDVKLDIPVHSGFGVMAAEIYQALKKEHLADDVLREYSVSFYGHSLGGAVASILAMYLHEDGANIRNVITFGAPRFTTNAGARKYQVLNAKTFRIVRCDDVVPFLPPPNFFGWSNQGYEANGSILLLLRPPYFDYSVGNDIERDFVHQLRTEIKNAGDRELLAYGHRMSNYESMVHNFTRGILSIGIAKPVAGIGEVTRRHFSSSEPEVSELLPVSYSQEHQRVLCPKRLAQ